MRILIALAALLVGAGIAEAGAPRLRFNVFNTGFGGRAFFFDNGFNRFNDFQNARDLQRALDFQRARDFNRQRDFFLSANVGYGAPGRNFAFAAPIGYGVQRNIGFAFDPTPNFAVVEQRGPFGFVRQRTFIFND